MNKQLLIGCGASRAKKLYLKGNEAWEDLVTLDVNPMHTPNVVHDLTVLPLPFENDTFSEIHAYEVLEHTGAQGDYKFFFAQFAEFWRILQPKGVLFATCPSRHSVWAWGDPSHTRVMQKEQLMFLCQPSYTQVGKNPMSDFRYIYQADFDVIMMQEERAEEGALRFALRAVKPARL